MSEKFAKKWGEGIDETPITTRIKEAVRPPGPLKPRIDYAVRRIEMQIQRLDRATDRFSERDKSIFARIWIFDSTSGAATHFYLGNVRADYAIFLSIGVIFGAQLGAYVSKRISGKNLRRILGVVLFLTSIRIFLKYI